MAKEPVDRERKVQELGLARKIMEVLSSKADEIAQEQTSGSSASSTKFRLEPAERVKLLEINNLGLVEGVGAGLFALVALRRVRAALLRRLWANQQTRNPPPPGAPPPPHTAPPPPSSSNPTNNPFHNNSPFHQANSSSSSKPFNPPPPLAPPPPPPPRGMPKQGTFMFLLGWMLDGLGAFSVMVTASFIFTDINKILDKLSTIPMVEGKSTIAREFCPDVVQKLNELKTQDAEAAAVIDTAKTKQLQAVLQFAENCQRRSSYEKRLRREKGVGPHYPVDVPAPGVPHDFPLDENDGSGMLMSDDGHHHASSSDFDFYDPRQEEEGTEAWADNFTDDRKS